MIKESLEYLKEKKNIKKSNGELSTNFSQKKLNIMNDHITTLVPLKPIIISNEFYEIKPLLVRDINHYKDYLFDLYKIYSNDINLIYMKEKQINSLEHFKKIFLGFIEKQSDHSEYNLLILDKKINRVIGHVQLISPKVTVSHYKLKPIWLFEVVLDFNYSGKGLTNEFLNEIFLNMKAQGVDKIGAIVNNSNIPSIKLLNKMNFEEHFVFVTDDYSLFTKDL